MTKYIQNQKKLIVIVFNSAISSGCDYALQTIQIVSGQHTVIGFCLGELVTWKNLWKRKVIHTHNGVIIIRPFFIIPGQRISNIRNVNIFLNAAVIRLFLHLIYKAKEKILWFFEPFNMPSILRVFSSYETVYDCVDYFSGFSGYARLSEEAIIQKVDHVFANSNILASLLKKKRKDITVVPLGFNEDLFRKYERYVATQNKKPVVGYIGGISNRLDFYLLSDLALALPEVIFWLVGPIEKDVYGTKDNLMRIFNTLLRFPNMKWTDAIPKKDVPKTISAFDIAMIPYDVSQDFNRYSYPMKLFEYFYMGKPVISTPIEELKRFPKFVNIGNTAQEWENYIRTILSKFWPKEYQKEQRKLAVVNSWEKKNEKIINIINSIDVKKK